VHGTKAVHGTESAHRAGLMPATVHEAGSVHGAESMGEIVVGGTVPAAGWLSVVGFGWWPG
jgi:hypothetical protein